MFMFFVVVGLGEIAQLQFQFVQFAPTMPFTLLPLPCCWLGLIVPCESCRDTNQCALQISVGVYFLTNFAFRKSEPGVCFDVCTPVFSIKYITTNSKPARVHCALQRYNRHRL